MKPRRREDAKKCKERKRDKHPQIAQIFAGLNGGNLRDLRIVCVSVFFLSSSRLRGKFSSRYLGCAIRR
jgi:hypothetical protein